MTTRVLAVLSLLATTSLAAPIITSSAVCTGGCSNDLQAIVNVNGSSLSASVYIAGGLGPSLMVTASATYDEDYTLTLLGGEGIGYFVPCLSIAASDSSFDFESSETAEAQFGYKQLSSVSDRRTTCAGENIGWVSLAFNTPTVFHLQLHTYASADSGVHGNGAFANAGFGGIRVPAGTTYTLVASLVEETSVPEPSTASLLMLASVMAIASVNCKKLRR